MKIVISAGHAKNCRGAAGSPIPPQLEEYDENCKVVEKVAQLWRQMGVDVTTFIDTVSTSQNENLNRIVNFHNAQPPHDYDVSIHFNWGGGSAHGTECLYVTQEAMAKKVADAIAGVGFTNRGPKYRSDLFFLNNTRAKAILVETCFCDSTSDSNLYRQRFNDVCTAIAQAVAGQQIPIPPDPGPDPEPPTGTHPIIGKGDTGPAVEELQKKLGVLKADGDFGSITDTWVRAFQASCGLTTDGIVGKMTWAEVDALAGRVANGTPPLNEDLARQIFTMAQTSEIADYSWPGRGIPPQGYIAGMALSFAAALLVRDAPEGEVMCRAAGNPNSDALAWYQAEFSRLGMDNSTPGVDCMRHLFVLMIGLGPRESSGKYCEGRDMSASNVTSDTCEAGMFQTSWNIRSAHNSIPPLLPQFWDNPLGFLDEFKIGISPTANNLNSYGSGDGIKYQFLSRFCPLFHGMVTGVGLRTRRDHWGPVNRREVTIKREANDLLKDVQRLMTESMA